MADQHFESGGEERVWDEYDWERFLQQQDRKTEKYMELLEKYVDDPNRDQIIAKEMGWHHLLDETGKDWSANLDTIFGHRPGPASKDDEEEEQDEEKSDDEAEFEEADEDELTEDDDLEEFDDDEEEEFDDGEEEDEEDEANGPARNRYDRHPLYQAASALAVYVDGLFAGSDAAAQHPEVARLTTSATLANVKLAAALTDDDVDELGMTIAYLKRALKAITIALEATTACEQENVLDALQAREVRGRIFQVRDGVVSLMGHYRGEWRRRFGQGH